MMVVDRALDLTRMSARARTYTGIGAMQNAAFAVVCICTPQVLGSESLASIREAIPLNVWGVLFALVTFSLVVTGLGGSRLWARCSLVASAALAAAWAAGLLVGVVVGPTGPLLVIGLVSLAAKDLVMVANPYLTPFE